jgi:hypothetical protein
VPEDFRGQFRIEINIDSGPFAVQQEERWYSIEEFL